MWTQSFRVLLQLFYVTGDAEWGQLPAVRENLSIGADFDCFHLLRRTTKAVGFFDMREMRDLVLVRAS